MIAAAFAGVLRAKVWILVSHGILIAVSAINWSWTSPYFIGYAIGFVLGNIAGAKGEEESQTKDRDSLSQIFE